MLQPLCRPLQSIRSFEVLSFSPVPLWQAFHSNYRNPNALVNNAQTRTFHATGHRSRNGEDADGVKDKAEWGFSIKKVQLEGRRTRLPRDGLRASLRNIEGRKTRESTKTSEKSTKVPNVKRKTSTTQLSDVEKDMFLAASTTGPKGKHASGSANVNKTKPKTNLYLGAEALRSNAGYAQSPVRTSTTMAKTCEGAISILEGLFPKELNLTAKLNRSERIIPRIPFRIAKSADKALAIEETPSPFEPPRKIPSDAWVHSDGGKDVVVVVFRNGSKHLTEADFKRVMPGGQHIGAWTGVGDLLRVIPTRETDLERRRDYLIVFSNWVAAQKYIDHVKLLHEHSTTAAPHSLTSKVPPPPEIDHIRGTAKFNNPVYTYTLLPPSHTLKMRLFRPPFSAWMLKYVEHGGVGEIFTQRKWNSSVLLWLDGVHPPAETVNDAIFLDGRERGARWTIAARVKDALDEHQSKTKLWRLEEPVSAEKQMPENGEYLAQEPVERRKSTFFISFRHQDEAVRFALSWHKRDVTRFFEDEPTRWKGERVISRANVFS